MGCLDLSRYFVQPFVIICHLRFEHTFSSGIQSCSDNPEFIWILELCQLRGFVPTWACRLVVIGAETTEMIAVFCGKYFIICISDSQLVKTHGTTWRYTLASQRVQYWKSVNCDKSGSDSSLSNFFSIPLVLGLVWRRVGKSGGITGKSHFLCKSRTTLLHNHKYHFDTIYLNLFNGALFEMSDGSSNQFLVKRRCESIGHTLFWDHWLLRYGHTSPGACSGHCWQVREPNCLVPAVRRAKCSGLRLSHKLSQV